VSLRVRPALSTRTENVKVVLEHFI